MSNGCNDSGSALNLAPLNVLPLFSLRDFDLSSVCSSDLLLELLLQMQHSFFYFGPSAESSTSPQHGLYVSQFQKL